jgi:hypothetical protein
VKIIMKGGVICLLCTVLHGQDISAIVPIRGMDICYAGQPAPAHSMPRYANDLYSLGFSSDSKFAWIEAIHTDAVAWWQLTVVNLITDSVVERISWDNDTELQTYHDDFCTWKELISIKGEKIRSILTQHSISGTTQLSLLPEPAVMNGASYFLGTEIGDVVNPDAPAIYRVFDASVQVIQEGVGAKHIASLQVSGENAFTPVGFIKSPFENRAVAVTIIHNRGFEGTSENHFALFGCHLTSGFQHRGPLKKQN